MFAVGVLVVGVLAVGAVAAVVAAAGAVLEAPPPDDPHAAKASAAPASATIAAERIPCNRTRCQPILDAYALTVELLRDAGVQNLGALELPDTAPVITGEIPAPEGAPTVLLYSHYDVVPAGDEAL